MDTGRWNDIKARRGGLLKFYSLMLFGRKCICDIGVDMLLLGKNVLKTSILTFSSICGYIYCDYITTEMFYYKLSKFACVIADN